MTELLIRLFIRDKDNVQDPTVRQQYGTLSGYVMNDYVVYDAGDSDSDAPNGDENGGFQNAARRQHRRIFGGRVRG